LQDYFLSVKLERCPDSLLRKPTIRVRWYDGSGVRGHRPCHKWRRDTRWGKVLRNLARDFSWSGCGKIKTCEVFPNEVRAIVRKNVLAHEKVFH